jgi:hypothetical protein
LFRDIPIYLTTFRLVSATDIVPPRSLRMHFGIGGRIFWFQK